MATGSSIAISEDIPGVTNIWFTFKHIDGTLALSSIFASYNANESTWGFDLKEERFNTEGKSVDDNLLIYAIGTSLVFKVKSSTKLQKLPICTFNQYMVDGTCFACPSDRPFSYETDVAFSACLPCNTEGFQKDVRFAYAKIAYQRVCQPKKVPA